MDLSGVTRDVVVPVRVDPTGRAGPTKLQARGKAWRHSSHAFYVPASVDHTSIDQRVVEAAAVLPDDWGGVTGWAALAWMGARWFDGVPWGGGQEQPLVLAVGGNRSIRPQAAFETSEERLQPSDLVLVDGVRLTTAVRSVCFEMRYAPDVRDAAITLSMACYDDIVSIAEVTAFTQTLRGWTGVPQAREALSLATENAWSPREVGLAHVWVLEGGRPWPLHNRPVFSVNGKLLGTPDVIDPVNGVYGEYDSALHLAGELRSKDVGREALFRSHGLEGAIMLAGDVPDPTAFLDRLHAAYDRAADVPVSRRRWTLEPPSWWRDTSSVTARRALPPHLRARLLRYRVA